MTDAPATFISIFAVDPGRRHELIDLLTEGAEQVIRRRPGFVSTTILASLDGGRVANITRWRAAADAQASRADPAAVAYAQRIAAIAQPSPALYQVAAEVG
jgi:heme-degrading monooxygenase HmoA